MKEKIIRVLLQIQNFQVFMFFVFSSSVSSAVLKETFSKQEIRRYATIALTPIASSILVSFAFPLTPLATVGGILFFAWAFILAVMAAAGKRAVEVAMDGNK